MLSSIYSSLRANRRKPRSDAHNSRSFLLVTTPFLASFLAMATMVPQLAAADEFLLFYLGGQSNMDGYGFVKQLPEDLKDGVPGAYVFHGNTAPDGKPVDGRGIWSELRAGHGVGFESDGQTNSYSRRFGVELTFARAIAEALPNQKIAIIKYSRGGTSIDQRAAGGFGCWEPDFEKGSGAGKGINQYDHFLATVRNAYADTDIDDDGTADRLIPAGIVWMQGESDAAMTSATSSGSPPWERLDSRRATSRVAAVSATSGSSAT